MNPHNSRLLLPSHRELLSKASAISDEVIAERQYRSVQQGEVAVLAELGFGKRQLQVPTLLMPVWNVHGEIGLFIHRPDNPRLDVRRNKVIKYEFPVGARMILDVHPRIRHLIGNPKEPLVIVEGIRKADAAISQGLCCIALLGVWNWRGTNGQGGKVALPDWEMSGLNKREVFIVFDSDTATNSHVNNAQMRFKAFLQSRSAKAYALSLPSGEGGAKVGLDDYFASGHDQNDFWEMAYSQKPANASYSVRHEYSNIERYRVTKDGLVWNKQTRDGCTEVPLTNFSARITQEIIEEDGVEQRRIYEIEAAYKGRNSRLNVSTAQFSSLQWINDLGAGAYVHPGTALKDHVCVAIKQLSQDPPQQRIFTYTGWRNIAVNENEKQWCYLHGNGLIGLTDNELAKSLRVRLSSHLEHFSLPDLSPIEVLRAAVRADLRLWDLAPDSIILPVFAAIYRAAICTADFSLFLCGPSGVFKSELAALAQQHFGAGFDARHLPGSWSSTDNTLEELAFQAKDALTVLDDFAPRGGSRDVQRLHSKADRVLRAQGNNSARGRMNADGSLRPARPPRGLLLSTGEDRPVGQSLYARTLCIDVAPNIIGADKLTECQKEARAGTYAQAMAGFLAWLAPQYQTVRDAMSDEISALRDQATGKGQHHRMPNIVAHLALGLQYFLQFAQEIGALEVDEFDVLWARGWSAILEAAQYHSAEQDTSEPAKRYIELLQSAIASGAAHIAGKDGGAPLPINQRQAWGWRLKEVDLYGSKRQEWQPQGKCIGYVDDEELYLIPQSAYSVAHQMGQSGDELSIGKKAMHSRLNEQGMLKSMETSARGTLVVRRVLVGKRIQVLHLHAATLLGHNPTNLTTPQLSQGGAYYAENEFVDTPTLNEIHGRILWSDQASK